MPRTKESIFRQRVTIERNRLVKLYSELSDESMKKCSRLFDQMAFLALSIEELQDNITQEGTTVDYQNGKDQWGTKTNPDIDTLNKFMQQYRHTKKSIDEELPKDYDTPVTDGFDEFVNG